VTLLRYTTELEEYGVTGLRLVRYAGDWYASSGPVPVQVVGETMLEALEALLEEHRARHEEGAR
jgi:hypothetical protein